MPVCPQSTRLIAAATVTGLVIDAMPKRRVALHGHARVDIAIADLVDLQQFFALPDHGYRAGKQARVIPRGWTPLIAVEIHRFRILSSQRLGGLLIVRTFSRAPVACYCRSGECDLGNML